MSATKKSLGRRCATCGEPISAHTLRDVSAAERVLVVRGARTRTEVNARIKSAQRVCPLVAVATPEGQPQRYQPIRLQNVMELPRRKASKARAEAA